MIRGRLKQEVLAAILIALTVTMSILVVIPVPGTHGLVTLCEVEIYISTILFGNPIGLIGGGASGFLIDIISGYPVWCLFSLVIHGLQGFTVAYLSKNHKIELKTIILPLLAGSVVMVVGYGLATSLLIVGNLAKIKPNWVKG